MMKTDFSFEALTKSFHQTDILKYMDCFLLYTKDNKQPCMEQTKTHFLTDSPKDVSVSIRNARAIYIHPDGFDYWIDILQVLHERNPLQVKLFLFCGSDYSIQMVHLEYWLCIFTKAQFWIQNWTGAHERCTLLPIGVNHKVFLDTEYDKTRTILITHFDELNSEERFNFKKQIDANPELQKLQVPKCSLEEYLKNLSTSLYSVCPTGNGYDSIRFWESLSVGSIPIVIQTPFIDNILQEYPEIEMIILQAWTDLPFFLQEMNGKYKNQNTNQNTNKNLDILKDTYWINKLQMLLETNQPNTLM